MAAIDMSNNNTAITVMMPFMLDVSGIEAELFGEEYELSGTLITVGNSLQTISFYNVTDESKPHLALAWLHYIQGDSEDDFDVYVNRAQSALLVADISDALCIVDGATYDAAVARDNLDASGVFTGATNWQEYHSLQDFVISWYANKILGHPAALAAISNDSYIRTQTGAKFAEGITAIHGVDACAFTNFESLDVDPTNERTSLSEVNDRLAPVSDHDNGMVAGDLQLIVQQVMNLAPGRFNSSEDRGYLAPLKWYVGDKIQLQLNVQGAKYRVAVQGANSTRTPSSRATGLEYVNSAAGAGQTYALADESFILEFTLA
jgi:hypothetical protein